MGFLVLPIPSQKFAPRCKKNAEMFFTEGNKENEGGDLS